MGRNATTTTSVDRVKATTAVAAIGIAPKVAAYEYASTLDCICRGNAVEACVAAFADQISPLDRECRAAVLAESTEGRDVLECRLRAEEDFIDCVAPEDGAAPREYACVETYEAVQLQCPTLTIETRLELEERCFGVEPFVCGDGEVVPRGALCDFVSDCADGSDESIAKCN